MSMQKTQIGRVFKVGDGVNTDYIISARYLDVYDPAELAQHLFELLGAEAAGRAKGCSFLVAGENLGLGSAREQAPNALKGAGYKAVIAKSAARIFLRNSINVGLPVIFAPQAVDAVNDGDELTLDMQAGSIRTGDGREFAFQPFTGPVQKILDAGGMFPLLRAMGKSMQQGGASPWA